MASASAPLFANEKLAQAQQYKEQGNAAFRDKNYKLAIGHYHRALLYIRGLDQHAVKLPDMLASAFQRQERELRQAELTEQLTEQVDHLRVDCYNNLAACLLQCKERFRLDKVLQYTDEVLEVRPTNTKAWYRRAQAFHLTGDYQEARQCLLKARQHADKPDPAVERLMTSCDNELKKEYQKQKSLYQGMFGGGGGTT